MSFGLGNSISNGGNSLLEKSAYVGIPERIGASERGTIILESDAMKISEPIPYSSEQSHQHNVKNRSKKDFEYSTEILNLNEIINNLIINNRSDLLSQKNFSSDYSSVGELMQKKIDKLSASIKETCIIKEEYYDFLEIQRIMKVIIKNNTSENDKSHLKFLSELLEDFNILSNFKFDLNKKYSNLSNLDEKSKNDFVLEYKKFEKKLFNYKLYFYTEIFSPDADYKNVVDQLYNASNPNKE